MDFSQFTRPSLATLMSWASTVAILVGAYWYMEDNRREMQDIHSEIRISFEREAERDANWLETDTNQYLELRRDGVEIRNQVMEIEDALHDLVSDLATSRDDINYRMGRAEVLLEEATQCR